jgi:hypothetical protein
MILWLLGYPDQALQKIQDALALAQNYLTRIASVSRCTTLPGSINNVVSRKASTNV